MEYLISFAGAAIPSPLPPSPPAGDLPHLAPRPRQTTPHAPSAHSERASAPVHPCPCPRGGRAALATPDPAMLL